MKHEENILHRLQQLRDRLAAPLPHPDATVLQNFQEQVAQWSLHHFQTMPEQKLGHGGTRAEMEKLLRQPLPEEGVDFDGVLADFRDKIVPNTFRIQHPRFLAFIPCAPTYYSILGDWLAGTLNCFPSVWFEGSAASQVELVVLDWFKEILGLPAETRGILTSGGSEANLTALVVARDQLPYEERSCAVLYQSDQRHWSVDRAARVIGLRPNQIRLIATDECFQLSLPALEEAIAEDRRKGHHPWAVVANAGTTNTGAADPMNELADLCDREKLWLHVDGAYGWAAALTPEGKESLQGIHRADSITLDPHKWFAQTFEAGCVLVRDGRLLAEAFAMQPEYLQDVAPTEEEPNLADYGLTLTRRFRALKIWLSVRALGMRWFRDMIDRSMKLAELCELLLCETGKFELLSPRSLSVICFRYRPPEFRQNGEKENTYLDTLNSAIQEEIYKSGRAFLTSTQLRGKVALRCCFVNWRTTAADVQEVVGLLASIGDRLASSKEKLES